MHVKQFLVRSFIREPWHARIFVCPYYIHVLFLFCLFFLFYFIFGFVSDGTMHIEFRSLCYTYIYICMHIVPHIITCSRVRVYAYLESSLNISSVALTHSTQHTLFSNVILLTGKRNEIHFINAPSTTTTTKRSKKKTEETLYDWNVYSSMNSYRRMLCCAVFCAYLCT